MNEAVDLSSHILVVAIIAFYWTFLSVWAQAQPPPQDRAAAHYRTWAKQSAASLTPAFDAIRQIDRNFDDNAFLAGASNVYEIILSAYAEGDANRLKKLVGAEVFEVFQHAMVEREDRQETLQLTFVGTKEAVIVGASLEGSTAQIAVRFIADVISVTRSAADAIISGDPGKIVEVTDVWTFARDVSSTNPGWLVIATDEA
jgi:predicted lipid-binding transport protein (Tim44 family)